MRGDLTWHHVVSIGVSLDTRFVVWAWFDPRSLKSFHQDFELPASVARFDKRDLVGFSGPQKLRCKLHVAQRGRQADTNHAPTDNAFNAVQQ